jgi:hypothetical protein
MDTCDIHFPFYSTALRISRTIWVCLLDLMNHDHGREWRITDSCMSLPVHVRVSEAASAGEEGRKRIEFFYLILSSCGTHWHLSETRHTNSQKKGTRSLVLVYKFLFFAVSELL